MITLITGQPGAGKTALAVSMLMEEAGTRPVFVMGIPELKLPHEKTPPVAEWTVDVPSEEDETIIKSVFTFPPNSIIVIDEAQSVYRPRGSASKVPPYVAAFETHRHTGVDFWLITQEPGLLDSNIRKLVGRHFHIRDLPIGRYLYEWGECGNPDTKSSRDAAARRRYRPPKKTFDQYKSANLHLKTKKTVPFMAWVILACVIGGAFLWWRSYESISSKGKPKEPELSQNGGPVASAPAALSPPVVQAAPMPVTAADIFRNENPRIADRPETAPMYDGVRPMPVASPAIAGCVASAAKCTCFTHQATVYPAPDNVCRDYIKNPPFNPYAVRDASPMRQFDAPSPSPQPDPPVADSGVYSVPDTRGGPNLMVTPDRVF